MKKNILTMLFAILIATPISALAFGEESCGGEKGCGEGKCTQCHSMTREEAETLLKAKKLGISIADVKASEEVKGLWEVNFIKDGKAGKVHIDFGKKYLVQGSFTKLEDLGKKPELKKVDLKKINFKKAVLMGSKKAKKKVVVFDDVDCPFCKKLHKEIHAILKERKDIAFYIVLFPLPMHPAAMGKSVKIICADKKDQAKLLDMVMEGKKIDAKECQTKQIEDNIALAREFGISGTPGIVLPDGRLLPGYMPKDALLKLIDESK